MVILQDIVRDVFVDMRRNDPKEEVLHRTIFYAYLCWESLVRNTRPVQKGMETEQGLQYGPCCRKPYSESSISRKASC